MTFDDPPGQPRRALGGRSDEHGRDLGDASPELDLAAAGLISHGASETTLGTGIGAEVEVVGSDPSVRGRERIFAGFAGRNCGPGAAVRRPEARLRYLLPQFLDGKHGPGYTRVQV